MIENPNVKTLLFSEKLALLDTVTDVLGNEVEPAVKEIVVALNLLGIPTHSSCEGHNEPKRVSLPYLQGAADNRPLYRHVGEEKIATDIMEKYGLTSLNDIFDDDAIECEFLNQIDDLPETDEYKKWMMVNKDMSKKVEALVAEFNDASADQKLHLTAAYPSYRIEAYLGDVFPTDEVTRREWVEKAQQTFEAFKVFVKNKYFAS